MLARSVSAFLYVWFVWLFWFSLWRTSRRSERCQRTSGNKGWVLHSNASRRLQAAPQPVHASDENNHPLHLLIKHPSCCECVWIVSRRRHIQTHSDTFRHILLLSQVISPWRRRERKHLSLSSANHQTLIELVLDSAAASFMLELWVHTQRLDTDDTVCVCVWLTADDLMLNGTVTLFYFHLCMNQC